MVPGPKQLSTHVHSRVPVAAVGFTSGKAVPSPSHHPCPARASQGGSQVAWAKRYHALSHAPQAGRTAVGDSPGEKKARWGSSMHRTPFREVGTAPPLLNRSFIWKFTEYSISCGSSPVHGSKRTAPQGWPVCPAPGSSRPKRVGETL